MVKTTIQFIEKAISAHGIRYGYSKVIYTINNSKVIIICNEHGEFLQTPYHHLRKQGCFECGKQHPKNKQNNTEQFIKSAILFHGIRYGYSDVIYINAKTKVKIHCEIHGIFEQLPNNHLKKGCNKCGRVNAIKNTTKTTEQFIQEVNLIHNNLYGYIKTIYVNVKKNIIITCKIHGDFEQVADKHLHGHGCPSCINKTEGKLYNKLILCYSTIIRQLKNEWCSNKKKRQLPFDFCIPENKIIIELDGGQHFEQVSNWTSPEEQFENDKFKEKCANENGYSIIRILQEDVWNDTYDWYKELCDTIQEIITEKIVVNKYLCKNGEYDTYI